MGNIGDMSFYCQILKIKKLKYSWHSIAKIILFCKVFLSDAALGRQRGMPGKENTLFGLYIWITYTGILLQALRILI
jgi:hypothetical protein